ncbi:MAG: glutamate synthase subunit beta [Deltaproteobacteria bacterium]|nr:glutamate synthase subunit beta [Deltaproteobacteria bacterium]
MGDPSGFLKIAERELPSYRPVEERIHDYEECYQPFPEETLQKQASRCMDCGIPFCHNGCPLGNIIPDWNDLVYRNRWQDAIDRLHATNNFPEFTGRICPAPCEAACVLGINQPPVTIKQIEVTIIDHAWREGWIRPQPPKVKTGKKAAVVGSGPAGLACAQQLARAGHAVTLFERADRIGGLLRYGIPDFKMRKHLIDRRMKQMEAEGVTFRTGVNVGVDITAAELRKQFDAIVLCGGATQARDINVPGRELNGVYLAMDFLTPSNKRIAGDKIPPEQFPSAEGKDVVILGGGDTGADCLGTSIRQGARSITQFELMPRPPDARAADNPWPLWPLIYRTSSAHMEGGERDYAIQTKSLSGSNGQLEKLHCIRLNWTKHPDGRMTFEEIPGSEFEVKCNMLFLALGFLGPEKSKLIEDLGVELDQRGNVKAGPNKRTSVDGVFVAGDMTRGQSLVVWALAEGRTAAHHADIYLMGGSQLPAPL